MHGDMVVNHINEKGLKRRETQPHTRTHTHTHTHTHSLKLHTIYALK